jgi:signal transduction histidine kinase
MIKIATISILFLFFCRGGFAQQNPYWEDWSKDQIDSLQSAWTKVHNDTLRMAIARSLGFYYQEKDRDSSLYFSEQQLALADKLHQTLWQADASDQLGYVLAQMKNYPRSLQCFLEGISIAENEEAEKNIWRISVFSLAKNPKIARLTVLGYINNDVSVVYRATANTEDALNHLFTALAVGEEIENYAQLSMTSMGLGSTYLYALNKPDSALAFAEIALRYADTAKFQKYRGESLTIIANIYLKKGNTDLARKYFAEAMRVAQDQNNGAEYGASLLDLARLFSASGNSDSSLWYANKGLETLKTVNDPQGMINAYLSLVAIYKSTNELDSAFKYQSLAMQAKEQLDNVEKINQFKNVGFSEQEKLQQLEMEKTQFKNRVRTSVLVSGLGAIFIIALLLYRNIQQKKKANHLLAKQKEEIQNTLLELESTQAQLIQAEKMASLGELTAGIAHEIQNPLNFVNNFSEVNAELIDELEQKANEGDVVEVRSIAKNIKENEQKINFHGKRADAIVKGMLQHSRTSSGQKELTDINALCDEYLRLAYHGLRAKEKSFNARFETDFDPSIGRISIVPQDIGRVILNLINNAFYAVSEMAKRNIPGYEPTVTMGTRRVSDKIELKVTDNGNGIPQAILDKIFQPFFTTKPTGQGTGLGLSLSYDIIKAHGGEIKVETRDSKGTEFTVQLPVRE